MAYCKNILQQISEPEAEQKRTREMKLRRE